MILPKLASRLADLKRRTHDDPLHYIAWTKPQRAFIEDKSRQKLLVGGNQIGKSWAAAGLLLYHALGIHPTIRGVTKESWLVCHSHEQSRTLQAKLYELTPKYTLHPDCEFVKGKGFRGLAPVVRFKEEYGGAIIRIKTAQQGIGLESATCGLIVCDEPITQEVYNACLSRTLRGGTNGTQGIVAITMTPVGGVDVSYIKDMVESGKISTHRGHLTLEHTTPMKETGEYLAPILSQEQIDDICSQYLPIDRHARIYGSFDVQSTAGVIFDNFDPDCITAQPVPAGGRYTFAIGIDHGSNINTQIVILACIDKRDKYPRVYILDEYASGQAPPEHHARAILDMVENNGLKPEQIEYWTGDGEHHARRSRDGFKMNNIMIMRAMEDILQYPPRGLPYTIRRPWKGRHSVYFSCSLIHSCMSRKHFFINPKCKGTIDAIKFWTMQRTKSAKATDKHGHYIDALRYCLTKPLDTKQRITTKLRIV